MKLALPEEPPVGRDHRKPRLEIRLPTLDLPAQKDVSFHCVSENMTFEAPIDLVCEGRTVDAALGPRTAPPIERHHR